MDGNPNSFLDIEVLFSIANFYILLFYIRWKTLQPHDIYAECQKFSLDPLDAIKEATYSVFTHKNLSQESLYPQKLVVTTPVSSSTVRTENSTCNLDRDSSRDQKPITEQSMSDDCVPYLSSQELSLLWSPSFLCGLSTPPSSQPISPAGSVQDIPSLSEFVQRPMTPVAGLDLKETNNCEEAFTSTPIVSRRRSGGELKKSSHKAHQVANLNLKSKSSESVDTSTPGVDKEASSGRVTPVHNAKKKKEHVPDRPKNTSKYSPMLARAEILELSGKKTKSAPNTPLSRSKDAFAFAPTQATQEPLPSQASHSKRAEHSNISTPLPATYTKSLKSQSPAVKVNESPLHGLSVNLLKVIKDLQEDAISKQCSLLSNVEDGMDESERCCTRLKAKSPFELLDEFIECGSNIHSLQLSR